MRAKQLFTGFVALAVLGCAGVPVVALTKSGFWLLALAAAAAVVLGMTGVAETLVPAVIALGLGCVILGGAIGAGQEALADPGVQIALGLALLLALAVGIAVLLGKATMASHGKSPKPRYGVAERVARADPIPLDRVFGGRHGGDRAAPPTTGRPDSDDDLGIFSRRRS